MYRRAAIVVLLCAALCAALCAGPAAAQDGQTLDLPNFYALQRESWPLAQAKGITRATFDAAFAGLSPDNRVIAITRRQPEYNKPVGEYVDAIATKARIETGARKAAEWSATFDRIDRDFGVERTIILGIWAIETSYGAGDVRFDVIRSIASLVYAGYRVPYFRGELLAALRILQDGHVARDKFFGSYAGAMGQPQFMPTSFYEYAIDFSGDGKRDIWTTVPDVLGSIANYLHKHGWQAGVPWGFEIVLPQRFDYRQSRGSFRDWAQRGLSRADGGALPVTGEAILYFPSGAGGPAFLVTPNFVVLKTYNNSDVYSLAVSHLADRLRGAGPIRTPWRASDPQLSREDRVALQKKLAQLGYKVKDFDGRIDFDLRDAIRAEQVKLGMLPDGHPTEALLTGISAGVR